MEMFFEWFEWLLMVPVLGVVAVMLFRGAGSGGAAENNTNGVIGDNDDGFWKPELNEWLFMPGSVPNTMFIDDDD